MDSDDWKTMIAGSVGGTPPTTPPGPSIMPQPQGPTVSDYRVLQPQSSNPIPKILQDLGIPTELPTLNSALEGGASLFQGIAAYRQGRAESKLTKALGIEEANRVYARLSAIASTGRAVAGAQGPGGGQGSAYMTEMSNRYQAILGAKTAQLPYQAEAMAQRRKANLLLRAGIMRAGTALISSR